MSMKKLAIAIVAILGASLILAPTAAAHKTTYTTDGKIKIVWGFLNEPAVTWTKTGLDLRFSDNATGAPILGAADAVEAHLKHGEDELHLDALAGQFGNPGAYTQIVTLTKPGLYTLNLHGTINGSAIDMDIPAAHEIHSVEESFFPAVPESPYAMDDADDADLEATIAALTARVASLEAKAATMSETPATVTPQPSAATSDVPMGALLVALGLVGAALILRRRRA